MRGVKRKKIPCELDELTESIPKGERVTFGGDFNGHVGEGNRGDEEIMSE